MELNHILNLGFPDLSSLEIHNSLPSTNTYARHYIKQGCNHGTIIWALNQTAGRGRLERDWIADNNSLTFSLIWRFADYSRIALLPLAIGLGITRSLNQIIPEVKIKWPNDLWIGERKLGGILGESIVKDGDLWTIIGVGLNINGQLTLQGDNAPISMQETTGEYFVRFGVLNNLLPGILWGYAQVNDGELDLNREFRQYGNFLDRAVVLWEGKRQTTATPRAVLSDGQLLVETPSGLRSVLPTEISLRLPS